MSLSETKDIIVLLLIEHKREMSAKLIQAMLKTCAITITTKALARLLGELCQSEQILRSAKKTQLGIVEYYSPAHISKERLKNKQAPFYP